MIVNDLQKETCASKLFDQYIVDTLKSYSKKHPRAIGIEVVEHVFEKLEETSHTYIKEICKKINPETHCIGNREIVLGSLSDRHKLEITNKIKNSLIECQIYI